MAKKTDKLLPARSYRKNKEGPGPIEAIVSNGRIAVYWETDPSAGEQCCALFDAVLVDLRLLAVLLNDQPDFPDVWVRDDPLRLGLQGEPRILRVDIEKRPSREELEKVLDHIETAQRFLLEATKEESICLLAHCDERVRAYARSRICDWSEKWDEVPSQPRPIKEDRLYLERKRRGRRI